MNPLAAAAATSMRAGVEVGASSGMKSSRCLRQRRRQLGVLVGRIVDAQHAVGAGLVRRGAKASGPMTMIGFA